MSEHNSRRLEFVRRVLCFAWCPHATRDKSALVSLESCPAQPRRFLNDTTGTCRLHTSRKKRGHLPSSPFGVVRSAVAADSRPRGRTSESTSNVWRLLWHSMSVSVSDCARLQSATRAQGLAGTLCSLVPLCFLHHTPSGVPTLLNFRNALVNPTETT